PGRVLADVDDRIVLTSWLAPIRVPLAEVMALASAHLHQSGSLHGRGHLRDQLLSHAIGNGSLLICCRLRMSHVSADPERLTSRSAAGKLMAMGVFDKVDRVLDRLDRFDDWVRDRLPASWVKTVLGPNQVASSEANRALDLVGALALARLVILVGLLAVWLVVGGQWWMVVLGAAVVLIGGSVITVVVREALRRR
ncbi:MAG TPA: hypothetical protein VG076_14760, partial [Acidimicrobiales bacterium]|nr:hypothetical protein [Acidimicrobiales bacterium]